MNCVSKKGCGIYTVKEKPLSESVHFSVDNRDTEMTSNKNYHSVRSTFVFSIFYFYFCSHFDTRPELN